MSTIYNSGLKNSICLFDLLLPYKIRMSWQNEHPFFPYAREIEVFWSFFSVGLCLVLDPDLCPILEFDSAMLGYPKIYKVYDCFHCIDL